MKSITIILYAVIVAVSYFDATNGFVHSVDLNGRIVNGNPIPMSSAPYQVALLLDYWNMGIYSHACGGSIIERNVILTAAHCTHKTQANYWRIRAGTPYHDIAGSIISVIRFTQHPSFNSNFDNDICLLFLNSQLNLGTNIALVSLPIQGQPVVDGTTALITGWGSQVEGGLAPNQLQGVNVTIVNQQICVAVHANFNPVTDRMICAGNVNIEDGDTCYGDAGGPMVVDGEIIGITSWGDGCGQINKPGVYTRVASFRDWIDNNI